MDTNFGIRAVGCIAACVACAAASGQVQLVSQSRSVSTGVDFGYIHSSSSSSSGEFNQSLDNTYVHPFGAAPLRASASQQSVIAPGFVNMTSEAEATGSDLTGGGQISGAIAQIILDVTFELSIATPYHLFGENHAASGWDLYNGTSQYVRLTRVGGAVIVDRTYIFESFGDTDIIPEMNDGIFSFSGILEPGRYRFEAKSEHFSGGLSGFGPGSSPLDPNIGSLNVTLIAPAPSTILLIPAFAALGRRRRIV